MFKKILRTIGQYTKAALQAVAKGSGPVTLYFCTSAFLAAILLTAILTYKWDIDKTKWYRVLAILQGLEIVEIQKAEQDRAAEISYENVLARRAERLRAEEYHQAITQQIATLPPPPEEPKPPPPPPAPSDAERISAYTQRVREDLARATTAGLDEVTRLIGKADPDWAKEVIRKLWKDGANQRVLQMITAMEDRERERILYAMQESNDQELKDLCEILQRIADGEPMTSIINNAAKEP